MPEVLGTQEVAERLGRSVDAVRGLIRRGAIPAPFRLGRRVVWRRETFDGWIKAQETQAEQGVRHAGR